MIGNINAFLQQSFAWSTRDIYSTSVKVSRSGIASGGRGRFSVMDFGTKAVVVGVCGAFWGDNRSDFRSNTRNIPKTQAPHGVKAQYAGAIGVPLEAWASLMLSRDFRLSIRRSFVNRGELAFIDLNFGLIYAGIIQFFNQKNAKKHQKNGSQTPTTTTF